MYRVSPFVRHFARALGAGIGAATLWVNLAPSSYYDFVEWRLTDLHLPVWLAPAPYSLTPGLITTNGLMALFIFFVGKELWEAIALERSSLSGRGALMPLGGAIGAAIGAVLVWIVVGSLIETAQESSFAVGWPVSIASDVVLGYVVGRLVFGAGHPALHMLLLVAIASDFLLLVTMGLTDPPDNPVRLAWLAVAFAASYGVWALFGKRPDPDAPERLRRKGLMLWPYVLAGGVSYVAVAAAGLPPCLGLLPVIPAIPHAERSFGLFAEAETFLNDPLNRLAHLLVRPLALVLFLFGLTQGGIDLAGFAPTTLTVLAAAWIGKPVGFLLGCILVARLLRAPFPQGVDGADLGLMAIILGMGFTIPVLAIETTLPGGGMQEAARLGLAISLLAGGAAIALARRRVR